MFLNFLFFSFQFQLTIALTKFFSTSNDRAFRFDKIHRASGCKIFFFRFNLVWGKTFLCRFSLRSRIRLYVGRLCCASLSRSASFSFVWSSGGEKNDVRERGSIIPSLFLLFSCFHVDQHRHKTEVMELFVYGFNLNVFDHFFPLCEGTKRSCWGEAQRKLTRTFFLLHNRCVLRQTTCLCSIVGLLSAGRSTFGFPDLFFIKTSTSIEIRHDFWWKLHNFLTSPRIKLIFNFREFLWGWKTFFMPEICSLKKCDNNSLP